ncbi:DUF1566 domain-containing protein, partial [candidate division KSB1 bacterium]|nr:DUF1566 domain-containing protein [candidate division KSB1 bacterium]
RRLTETLQSEFTFHQIDTLYNEEATGGAIMDRLRHYSRQLTETDGLFIYYGGHGRVDKNTGYLIPHDGTPDILDSNNIFMSHLLPFFKNIIPARHILLTIASCFSGEFLVTRSAQPETVLRDVKRMRDEKPKTYESRLQRLVAHPARQVLTAGHLSEEMIDNWKESDLSPFAQLFLDGLNECRSFLDAEELAGSIRSEMKRLSDSGLLPMPQTPQFANLTYQEKGCFVFQRRMPRPVQPDEEVKIKKEDKPVQEIVKKELRGRLVIDCYAEGELYIDGQLKDTLQTGDSLELELRVGSHTVELRHGDKKRTETVKITKGDAATLEFDEWPQPAAPRPVEPEPIKTQVKKPAYKFRSEAAELSDDDVKAMLKAKDLFATDWNPDSDGFRHAYETKTIDDDKVVIDHATGLMWQQGGSDEWMVYEDAKKWIAGLNREGYAGYNDWRLPTLEEAMSLMESSKKNGDLYIDPAFNNGQQWIWTSDYKAGTRRSRAWTVCFGHGTCYGGDVDGSRHVRAVRSGQSST